MSAGRLFHVRLVLNAIVVADDEEDAADVALTADMDLIGEPVAYDRVEEIRSLEELDELARSVDDNPSGYRQMIPVGTGPEDDRSCEKILRAQPDRIDLDSPKPALRPCPGRSSAWCRGTVFGFASHCDPCRARAR